MPVGIMSSYLKELLVNKKSRFSRAPLGLGIALLLICLPAFAQTSLGTIVGTITDESGAAIPHVAITVTNEATAAARNAVTSEAGVYTIPSLPPGVYTIHAEMKGFRTEIQKGIE